MQVITPVFSIYQSAAWFPPFCRALVHHTTISFLLREKERTVTDSDVGIDCHKRKSHCLLAGTPFA